jgi:putative two-component system response regulator
VISESPRPALVAGIPASVLRAPHLKGSIGTLGTDEYALINLAFTVEARDPYADRRCERISRNAVSLGRMLGLSHDELEALRFSALLRDVGNVGIPSAVLLKHGRLSDDEYELVKQHTVIGERLCAHFPALAVVRPIVRQHHERWDGTGYPDRLRGNQISLLAQILGIVDTFDAMTTSRSYRSAFSRASATADLRAQAARGQMNVDLVEAFLGLPPEVCGEH